ALGRRAAQASAVFREPALAEAIKHSRVVNDHVIVRRRLLTSEGAWTDERRALARLHVVASADPDATFWSGLDLTFDAASPEELPGAEAVARGARQLAAEAIASRKAPRAEAGKAV